MEQARKKLVPVLEGNDWLIGENPDLKELQGKRPTPGQPSSSPVQECVDHTIFQTDDGMWHLWGCVRNTAVGRLFYHWETDSLEEHGWKQTGEYLRADVRAGENLDDRDPNNKLEDIKSPYVQRHNGMYYLFYSGHIPATDALGNPQDTRDETLDYQMNLMLSHDGRNWKRHQNEKGWSRIFVGPGQVRDTCILRYGDIWVGYWAGFHDRDNRKAGFYARTSSDLVNWSDWMMVHYDLQGRFGSGRYNCECPHVVKRGSYYYLFRTEFYPTGDTHVFRSENPFDFGVGDASAKYVCSIHVAAPEIIVDPKTGREYISSSHDRQVGERLCRLAWKEESK